MLKSYSKYLIRLDDACPTDKREIWNLLEERFDKLGIRPIVAVIPVCESTEFRYTESDCNFWKRISRYQEKGYTIALHGYKHVYVTNEKGLVPLNNYSEFAGLPLDEQRIKIKNAYQIMHAHGIDPTVWIAPAHSFDKNTLVALKLETNIRIISDGFALFPFEDEGFLWIPQQLWRIGKRPFGIWTVCLHPNTMDEEALASFLKQLELFRSKVIAIDDILAKKGRFHHKKKLYDIAFEKMYFLKRKLRKNYFLNVINGVFKI